VRERADNRQAEPVQANIVKCARSIHGCWLGWLLSSFSILRATTHDAAGRVLLHTGAQASRFISVSPLFLLCSSWQLSRGFVARAGY
jgi:hypothetical protein